MASLVYIDRSPKNANLIMAALDKLKEGIALLRQNDGKRAQAIADGQSTFATLYGVQDDVQAQALNDRWDAFLSAYEDPANLEYGKLRDLLDATFETTGVSSP